jgi:adenosylhomocysteinase
MANANTKGVHVDQGLKKIEWSTQKMPLLQKVSNDFAIEKPFTGLTIGVSLHIEQKTAVLLLALQAGGANIVATGNYGTTQDDIAAALTKLGITVYGCRSDSRSEHMKNVEAVVSHNPDLLLDNGADLTKIAVRDTRFSVDDILGGTEETTSGGLRMREEMDGEVPFPMIVINDSPLKLIVENKHGVGQSIVESFNRITNLMIQGKRIAVFGYGWCGRGIAKYFRCLGAQVAVVEINPILSLEAAVDGHKVLTAAQAATWASVVITATGRKNVVDADLVARMNDGVILGNAGHFDWEINVPAIKQQSVSVDEVENGITRYEMPGGKRIIVLCDGRMFNLGGREPKGNTLECMDMGFTLQALSQEFLVNSREALVSGPQPVPDEINKETAKRMLATMG